MFQVSSTMFQRVWATCCLLYCADFGCVCTPRHLGNPNFCFAAPAALNFCTLLVCQLEVCARTGPAPFLSRLHRGISAFRTPKNVGQLPDTNCCMRTDLPACVQACQRNALSSWHAAFSGQKSSAQPVSAFSGAAVHHGTAAAINLFGKCNDQGLVCNSHAACVQR